MNTFEIELRFEILNPEEISSFTSSLKKLSTRRIIDIYLDTPDIALLRKGVYMRIRDQKKLDIKFNRECMNNPDLDLQAYCEEYTFALPLHEFDVDDFNSIVKTIGLLPITKADFDGFQEENLLAPHRTVDKVRTSYAHGPFTIVIDAVANLGNFLEIEYLAQTVDSVDTIKAQMEELLLPLSLKPLQTGYDSLMLRKHNFKQYLQGRFVLDEDKLLRKKALAQNQL
jgi:adenylate cyclase class IV